MLTRLEGKTALVTGGASGLGAAIARRLAAEGARVVISDVQRPVDGAVASASNLTFMEHDVSNEDRWYEVVREMEEQFGALNILVNNAGMLTPMEGVTPENTLLKTWRKMFAVNVEGVFLGCKAALPAMRRSGTGSIINISSVAGLLATPFATAYGASKAAVRHLTKSVAQYCAQERLDIRCNSVHPGNVRTAGWDRQAQEIARLRGVPVEIVIAEGAAEVPMGDFTRPEDIAAMCAFLASEDARHVTGAKLIVDGGLINCDTYHMVPVNYAGDQRRPIARSENS